MTEQVEPDVSERDILFEFRRVRDPLTQPMREHQRIVAETERVLRHGLRRHDRRVGNGLGCDRRRDDVVGVVHRCGTASDSL